MFYKVELHIGHRTRTGDVLPLQHITAAEQHALGVLSEAFQGGHVLRRLGGYLTADGQAMIEPCSLICSFAEAVDGHLEKLWTLASEIATALEQESVLLTVVRMDGMMAFVGSRN